MNQHRWGWSLLVIGRAPLAGCPHLLADGKGYASGYATLACCCAVGRHLGVPRQNFHGSSPRPRLQYPPADRPPLCTRYQKERRLPCTVEHFGRRGKSVKKMRLIPAEKAFAFARKFQGLPGVTVSVC